MTCLMGVKKNSYCLFENTMCEDWISFFLRKRIENITKDLKIDTIRKESLFIEKKEKCSIRKGNQNYQKKKFGNY